LSLYISDIRGNSEFLDAIETEVHALTGNKDYKSDKVRSRKRKLHFDKKRDRDVQLTSKQSLAVNCLKVIYDKLLV
jgi:hypothetical protein